MHNRTVEYKNRVACLALAKRALNAGYTGTFNLEQWTLLFERMVREDEATVPKDRIGLLRIAGYKPGPWLRCLRYSHRLMEVLRMEQDPGVTPVQPQPDSTSESKSLFPSITGPMQSVLALRLDRDCYPTSEIRLLLEKYLRDNTSNHSVAFGKIANLHDFTYDIQLEHSIPLSSLMALLASISWILQMAPKPPNYFGKHLVGVD